MIRKIMVFTVAAAMSVSLCACGGSKEETKETEKVEQTTEAGKNEAASNTGNESDFKAVDVSSSGWKMSVENVQIAAELSNTSEVLGYASASSNTFEQKANEGNTYVLVKMLIEKDGATENIQWDKMLLTDADGNTYNRIDDSFIDSLSWMRISGTDLNFGSYEGWFAYEIPEDKAASGLVLSYQFADDEMKYELNDRL